MSKFKIGDRLIADGRQWQVVSIEHAHTFPVRVVDVATGVPNGFRLQASYPIESSGHPPLSFAAPAPAPTPHTEKKPTPAQDRKNKPLARGFLDYFPDAAMAVAEVSRVGNEQHHPGAPIHWEKGKSQDHADCCARHLLDRGTLDTDGMSHTAKVAWRALALLQTELEAADPELAARRQEQRDKAARGEK